jgi:transcriptional regulator with XRE-family HTH domain
MIHGSTNAAATTASLQRSRLARGYSLEDLAITTGLTILEITAAERGNPLRMQHVVRIEQALR